MTSREEAAPHFFTTRGLDRLSHRRGDEEWLAARLDEPGTAILPVWQEKNLLARGPGIRPERVPPYALGNLLDDGDSLVFLGELAGRAHFALGLPAGDGTPPERVAQLGRFRDLRDVAAIMDHSDGALLGYARAMTYWYSRHRFCGDCGSPTISAEGGHVRMCTGSDCQHQHFPRTDPAVIAIVTCGQRCLLGRKASWPQRMRSIIAGFVEPGESLEAAVEREVWEETGIRVCDVNYCSSQPWPFPTSLMLGFTANAVTDDIHLNDHELQDARWLSRREIVDSLDQGTLRLPTRSSISFQLITAWFDAGEQGSLADVLSASPDARRH